EKPKSTANWVEHGHLVECELSLPPPIGSNMANRLFHRTITVKSMTNQLTANWEKPNVHRQMVEHERLVECELSLPPPIGSNMANRLFHRTIKIDDKSTHRQL
ncbi:16979_t:CDS:2, partial [Gigaspora rosea]